VLSTRVFSPFWSSRNHPPPKTLFLRKSQFGWWQVSSRFFLFIMKSGNYLEQLFLPRNLSFFSAIIPSSEVEMARLNPRAVSARTSDRVSTTPPHFFHLNLLPSGPVSGEGFKLLSIPKNVFTWRFFCSLLRCCFLFRQEGKSNSVNCFFLADIRPAVSPTPRIIFHFCQNFLGVCDLTRICTGLNCGQPRFFPNPPQDPSMF